MSKQRNVRHRQGTRWVRTYQGRPGIKHMDSAWYRHQTRHEDYKYDFRLMDGHRPWRR